MKKDWQRQTSTLYGTFEIKQVLTLKSIHTGQTFLCRHMCSTDGKTNFIQITTDIGNTEAISCIKVHIASRANPVH